MTRKYLCIFPFLIILILGQASVKKCLWVNIHDAFYKLPTNHITFDVDTKHLNPNNREILFSSTGSRTFFLRTQTSVQYGKPAYINNDKSTTEPNILQFNTGIRNWQIFRLTRLIIFPFHVFW